MYKIGKSDKMEREILHYGTDSYLKIHDFDYSEYSIDAETSTHEYCDVMWKDKISLNLDKKKESLKQDRLVITGISICNKDNNFYIPINNQDREFIINDFKSLIGKKDQKVIFFNVVFDMRVFHKYGITFEKCKIFDDMVASHLIDENRPKNSLKYLTRTILGREVADYDETLNHYSKEFYQYALDDSYNTWLLYKELLPQLLSDNKLAKLFFKIEMPFQFVLLEMAIEGVLIDKPLLTKQQKILKEEIQSLEIQLLDYLDEKYTMQHDLFNNMTLVSKINFNSSQQLINIFNKLGLEITEKTPNGNPSVGKFTLKKHEDHEFVKILQQYKDYNKLYNAFVSEDGQIATNIQSDGKVRPNFLDTGTATGRMSCIAEGTKIQTVRDFSKEPEGKNIEDIKPGDLVYASDKYGALVTRRVKNTYYKGVQHCVKLSWKSLSNKFKGELVCTPDHKIKTLDGKWTRADKVGLTSDSEIGYNRRVGNPSVSLHKRAYSLHFQLEDYSFIYYPGMNKVKTIRHLKDAVKGEHVHHKDGNKLNDTYENLELMSAYNHRKLHAKHGGLKDKNNQQKAQDTLRKMRKLGQIKYNTDTKELSKEYCLEIAHKHKGMIKYIIKDEHHDFLTIKREMLRNGIDLKKIKKLYNETNHYFIGREDVGLKHVYDLEIEGDDYDTNNFFANEICVHNCHSPNLQQLPNNKRGSKVKVREVFTAPIGYKMFSCDYSSQEIFTMAHISRDPELIKMLKMNQDQHMVNANAVFKLGLSDEQLIKDTPEYDEVEKKYFSYRKKGKIFSFGVPYGMGAHKFSNDFGVSEEEAQSMIDNLASKFPRLFECIEETHKVVSKDFQVRSLAGRIRHFGEDFKDVKLKNKNLAKYDDKVIRLMKEGAAHRQSFNFLIQGLCADMVRAGMVNAWNRYRKYSDWGLKTVMQVHDEAVYIVKEEYVDEATSLVKKAFEDATKNFILPLKAEIEIGENYGNSKK